MWLCFGIVVAVGIVVAGGLQCLRLLGWEREKEKGRERERGRIKNNDKKGYLNEMVKKKKRSFDVECIVKWCVKCYKVTFLVAKC